MTTFPPTKLRAAAAPCSFMGWEDLEVVDPEAEEAKKGEKAGETGMLEQVIRREAAVNARAPRFLLSRTTSAR